MGYLCPNCRRISQPRGEFVEYCGYCHVYEGEDWYNSVGFKGPEPGWNRYLEAETRIREEIRPLQVLMSQGMTEGEALEFIAGVRRGLQARREGDRIPWNQVKVELGLS